MKQQFLEDKAGTIRLSVYSNNVQTVPSSATIVLKKPGGDTLQASTAATVGADGEITYALTSTHTADRDLNYIAEWTYVVSGTSYYETQLFDVVRSILSIPITDEDLYNELDSLRKTQKQDTSTATSATSSTLVDTVQRKEPDDYWNGGTIEIISGTGADQLRDVTDFVQSTSTISVSPDWATDPDNTSKYRIIRSYSKKILQSFEKLEQELYDKGRRHQLILESSQVRVPLTYLCIHFICLDLMNEVDDKWDRLAQHYWELYKNAFGNMRLEYDSDDSGTIAGDEEQLGVNTTWIGRG